MKTYDLIAIGTITKDVNVFVDNEETMYSGGSYCATFAAVNSGSKVAMVTKLADEDLPSLEPLREAGIDVYAVSSPQTTSIKNVYPSADVDQRVHYLLSAADSFCIEDIPDDVEAGVYQITAMVAGEIPAEVVKHLASKSKVGLDVQGFMRHVIGENLVPQDWLEKAEILQYLDFLKTDASEAEILTGETDRRKAIQTLVDMGAKEIVLTNSSEVLAYADGEIYAAPFKAKNLSGRTGRGDTCFGTYLAQRLHNGPEEALQFAAALTSLKMESPGPFTGTIKDVEELLATYRA